MTRRTCALLIGAAMLSLAKSGSAAPSWTKDGNCSACHSVALPGVLTVTNHDGTANPNNHGSLKFFQVNPGQTKTLFATLTGLGDGDHYMVMLKGLTGAGVNSGQAFQYGADCGWSEWWSTFFTDPPRSDDPSCYYVAPSGPGLFQYNITPGATCPNDYFDLTFAVVGVPKDGTGFFYGEEHFYIQVGTGTPVAPAIGLSKTAISANTPVGASPANDFFTVKNAATGTLNYTISSNAAWLTVSPNGGSSAGAANLHTVQYSTASLAAGSYSATITVAATGATNTPQTINVSLTVGGTSGNATAGQTLYNQSCLGCHSSPAVLAPAAGRITTNMVSVNAAHSGITLTTQQVADLQAYLATFAGGGSPSLVVTKTALTPAAAQGTNPAGDTFAVGNSGTGALNYTITPSATWLTVTPSAGSTTGSANTITVQYNAASLAGGSYSATITVASAGATNSPQTINVSLTITGGSGLPSIVLNKTTLTATTAENASPPNNSFTVTRGGQGTLNYTITDNATWLTVTPASGSSAGETNTITVQYSTASLAPNSYSATITIAATGATNTPQTIAVSLTVTGPGGGNVANGQTLFTQMCARCHSASGIASHRNSITTNMGSVDEEHGTMTLTTQQVADLKVYLGTYMPRISLNKTSLAPTAAQGTSPANDTFTVANVGQKTMSYTITDNASWLSVTPTSGSTTGPANTITVQYSTATLSPGTYSATITVAASSATNTPKTISVSLTITGNLGPPTIALNKTTLTATALQGGSPANDTFTVGNSGGSTLSYTITDDAAWLTVTPTNGSTAGPANTITVQYSTASLAPGPYEATITVAGTGATNTPQTIHVTLTIVAATPTIEISTTWLTPSVRQGGSPPAGIFTVRNSGNGTLSYAITSSADWLTVSPTSGSSTGPANNISVSYATRDLLPGSHTATISVSDTNATNNPQSINVALTIVPFMGDFDSDGDVDLADFGHFQACFNGPNRPYTELTGCQNADFDRDSDVDLSDFNIFQLCFNGPSRLALTSCPN